MSPSRSPRSTPACWASSTCCWVCRSHPALPHRVSLYDGGNKPLAWRSAAHGTSRYVPLALLMIAMLELNGGEPALIHGLGLALL